MDHTIIKEAATKIVANIKAMEDDITVLRNKQDIISTSDTTMTGSYPGRLSIEEIGGKCEQFTTTGAQLLNINNTFNGSPIIEDDGYTMSYTGKIAWAQAGFIISEVEAGQVWYANVESITNTIANQGMIAFQQKDANNAIVTTTYIHENKSSANFTIAENTVNITILVIANGSDSDIESDNTITVKGLMLSLTEGNKWEPYTGGQPSPNPDYPQEIKKTVVSEIKTHGKNLIDGVLYNGIAADKNFTIAGDAGVYRTVKQYLVKGTYTISFSKSINIVRTIIDGLYKEVNIVDITNYKFTVIIDGYIGITFRDNTSNTTVWDDSINVQIEEGSVATPYEPYTESTIALSQPIELYGIGDVQDTIEDGKVVRRFDKIVLDGDKNWVLATNGLFYYPNTARIKARGEAICDQYIRTTTLANPTVGYFDTAYGQLRFAPSTEGTVEEWIERVTNNPITVVYELAEPVTEELPLIDQTALNSLKTYDGITYVETDSEIKSTFQVEYGASKLGGYTLEGVLAGVNGTILGQSNTDRIAALEATLVNNI